MPAHIHGNVSSKVLIVVLHGGPGGSGLEYRTGVFSNELEKFYGIVYFDQRGQGMSQGKYTEISVDVMVEDVNALVKILKIKYGTDTQIYLYGHSWGGLLGSAFLVKDDYQTSISGWIESNGAHDLSQLNKAAIPLFLQVAEEQIQKGHSVEKWQEVKDWATAIDVKNITNEQSTEINQRGFEMEDYLRQDAEISQSSNGNSYLKTILISPLNPITSYFTGNRTNNALNDEVEATALTPQLSKIRIPCLFIYSKYDFVVPAALGKSAYEAVASSNKKLVIFEQSGHSPMDSEPLYYAANIKEFVESVSKK